MSQSEADVNPNWYVLVIGVPAPTEPLTLAPGVTVRPLPHRLTAFDIMAAGANGFGGAGALSDIAHAATCEIETAADGAQPPGFNSLNRAWLAGALLLLDSYPRIVCPAMANLSWGELRESPRGTGDAQIPIKDLRLRKSIPGYRGNLLDMHLKFAIPISQQQVPLDEAVASRIRARFDCANQMCTQNMRVYLAMLAAMDWRYAADSRLALARLWCGVEALLGINTELTYRASLIVAALLERRGEGRLELYRQIKRLYGKRSKAVHGDAIHLDELNDAVRESFLILSRLIDMTLTRGSLPSSEEQERALLVD